MRDHPVNRNVPKPTSNKGIKSNCEEALNMKSTQNEKILQMKSETLMNRHW
jgi:hypothetical protein